MAQNGGVVRDVISRASAVASDLSEMVAERLGVSRQTVDRTARGGLVVAALLALWVSGLPGALLGRAPAGVRNLPGVRAVAQVAAPAYVSSFYGLHAPISVAVTADGATLYVVDSTGDRAVRRVRTRDGTFEADLVPPLTEPGTRKPLKVAVDGRGAVYVVDRLRRTVDIFSPNGDWIGLLKPPGSDAEWTPLSVSVDVEGNKYVTNSHVAGPALVMYGADNKITGSLKSIVVDGVAVSFAHGVVPAPDGKLAISDSNNARIVLVDPKSGTAVKLGNNPTQNLALPRGMVLESHRLGLVVDANDHSLSAWDLRANGDGRVYQFGSPGIDDGEFLFPNDVAVDRSGRLYVADRDNDRVQVWR